ncbi:MAG: metallophosphoesterase [Gammaproteobacteria bacterium]|nr:metallophosphoesterase [Gammaproteobacteria bacterium]
MPQSFAHISDPHLTSLENASPRHLLSKRLLGYISWRRKRRAEHQSRVLQALQKDLENSDTQQLLITGDLTHIGLPEEFEQAARWLRELGDPTDIVLVPGNHDACVKMPWPDSFAHWQAYMDSDQDRAETFPSLRVRNGIAFIGLNSACPSAPLMATGTLGNRQLSRLAPLLEEAAAEGLFRVVFLHHPPLPDIEKWRKRLTDAAALREILVELGAELVLHGHAHRARQHTLETRAGSVLVAAAPSASALGLHGADIAAYSRYAVSTTEGGWELDIEGRRYNAQCQRFEALPIQKIPVRRK